VKNRGFYKGILPPSLPMKHRVLKNGPTMGWGLGGPSNIGKVKNPTKGNGGT